MTLRNSRNFRVSRKEIYEDHDGSFHALVPSRQLTPVLRMSATPTQSYKLYKMPVVKRKITEGLKYIEYEATDLSLSTFPDPADIFWHKIEVPAWKPQTRQFGTLTACGGVLYLIGGVSKEIHSHVISYQPCIQKWENVETRGCAPRFGHLTLQYGKGMIVYGGGTEYSQGYKQRECINGVFLYSGGKTQWQMVDNKGIHIQPRKFHAGCVIGKQLFIHGGLNNRNKVLNDIAIFDFHQQGWLPVDFQGRKPAFRAFHTMQTVLNADQTPESIENVNKTKHLNIKVPGLYVFGGIKEDGKPTNELNVLLLNGSQPEWVTPSTEGELPAPRMSHSMIFLKKLSILLIYGGKAHPVSKEEVFLSDVALLRLDIMKWNQVRVHGETPGPRASFAVEAIGSRVFIFGGITQGGYCGSDLFTLEVCQRSVRGLLNEDKRRSSFLKTILYKKL